MVVRARDLTARDFFGLPERPFEQLIDGELVVDEPKFRHQRVLGFLYAAVLDWTRAAPGRGEVLLGPGLHADDRNVLVPDLGWVPDERRPGRHDRRFTPAEGPPDLVVEVRSPTTGRYDDGTKRATYDRGGVAELWRVDPDREVIVVDRRSRPAAARFDVQLVLRPGDTLTSPLLPGLAIDVAEVFDR